MRLPIHPVTRPQALQGQTNGRIDPELIVEVPGRHGGATVRLIDPAARAWVALVHAAEEAGHYLKVGWPTASYRPHEDQVRLFVDRYTPHRLWAPGRKKWNGRWWSKKKGVAAAAVPGTSNHGWGLAVDIGEERDGDGGTESLDPVTLAWLAKNAHRFGWSWEV